MKITYINPTILIRRPIAELIGRLGEENEVSLFVPKKLFKKVDQNWHNYQNLKKARIYSYSSVNIPLINFEWPIPITPMFFIHLYKIYKNSEIIHLWTYFYVNSWFALLFKKFFKEKKLILSSDTFPGESFNPGGMTKILFKSYHKLFGRIIFAIPDKIHLYGKSMIKYAKKVGVKEKKIVIIPTGINLKKFAEAKSINREELGFKEDDFIIFYAGLITPRKGIDIMITIIKELSEEYPNLKLFLVGEGPNKKEYQKKIKILKLEDKIYFQGWRTDIPNLLKSANALLLPSRGEGLPGIVMEAMATGLPVIASNIPCIPDLIENKKSGYLCEMDNIQSFKDAIIEVINNFPNHNIKELALEKIKLFDWENIINQYQKLYGEMNE